jgi:YidC/Oxa1 family membrane protein insertase
MEDQGKRLLIALAISFAFLFFYQSYFVPSAPVETAQEKQAGTGGETSSTGSVAVIAPSLDVAAEALEPIAAVGEETLTVSTPLFTATLSNRGGVIKSLALVRYREEFKETDSHVEMVHDLGEEETMPLSAEFVAAGGPLGFGSALFRTEGKDVTLDAGETG